MKEWAMDRYSRLISGAVFCTLVSMCAQAESGGSGNHLAQVLPVRIVIQRFKVTDANLQLDFQIRNNANEEVWICAAIDAADDPSREIESDIHFLQDTQTLQIRRRHDVPADAPWYGPPMARYVRLNPGQVRIESLSLKLPVELYSVFQVGPGVTEVTAPATRLEMEIGYHVGKFPELIRDVLIEGEKYVGDITNDNIAIIREYFPGAWLNGSLGDSAWFLSGINSAYKDAGEFYVQYTFQYIKGEQVLHFSVDGVDIPYRPEHR